MFAEWRLTLRKAEHALKLGQLNEAGQFLTAPDVQSHRAARELKGQVVAALAQRAAENLRHGDSRRAWEDLAHAERLGGADKRVDEVRQEIVRRCLAEAMDYLNGGRPEAVVACLRQLGERGVSSVIARRLQEAAIAWQSGREHARAGRFAQAVPFLEAANGLLPECSLLADCLEGAGAGREKIAMLEAELHRGLSEQDWNVALVQAGAILAIAPEHVPARAARCRAWQAVETPASNAREGRRKLANHIQNEHGTEPTVLRPPGSPLLGIATNEQDHAAGTTAQRFLLWVDGVGGYLVCLGNRVSIGQPAARHVDVPIMADLSRLHAWIERDGEGYLLRAVRPAAVNGSIVRQSIVLSHDAQIVLGQAVRLRFRQPTPLSTTACIELESPHRLSLPTDGVILMAETCIIGPKASSHAVATDWTQELVLYRRQDELWCRTVGDFEVDGRPFRDHARLTFSSRVKGEGFSLALEDLPGKGSSHGVE